MAGNIISLKIQVDFKKSWEAENWLVGMEKIEVKS